MSDGSMQSDYLQGVGLDMFAGVPFVGPGLEAARRAMLQGAVWEREDNAVQRRAADLKAAGMSPLLAAGASAGNGPLVSSGGLGSGANSTMAALGTLAQMNVAKASIGKTVADTKLVEAQKRGVDLQNKFLAKTIQPRIETEFSDAARAASSSQEAAADALVSTWTAGNRIFSESVRAFEGGLRAAYEAGRNVFEWKFSEDYPIPELRGETWQVLLSSSRNPLEIEKNARVASTNFVLKQLEAAGYNLEWYREHGEPVGGNMVNTIGGLFENQLDKSGISEWLGRIRESLQPVLDWLLK